MIAQPGSQRDGPELLDARIGNVKLQNQPSGPRPGKGHRELTLGPAPAAGLDRIESFNLFGRTQLPRRFLAVALPDSIGLDVDYLAESSTAALGNGEALRNGSGLGQRFEKRFGCFGELPVL